MRFFSSGRREPGWVCINLAPERVDVCRVQSLGKPKPEILVCDSYRKEGDDVATLKRLRRELGLARYHCTTLLKSGEYQIAQVEAPKVPPSELKEAVRWRLKDVMDIRVETATVDALTIPHGGGGGGRSPQALAVAAPNDVIAATVRPFNDADVPLEVIDIPELAQRNVAQSFEEPDRGLAFLTFDETGGLLTFTCGGELYQFRRIDISLSTLVGATEDQRRLHYDRIVLELQRSMDNFDRQFNHITVSKVMVSPVPGADDFLQYLGANIGIPVATLDLAQALDFPGVPELREPARQAQCLQMIGAAMRSEAAA